MLLLSPLLLITITSVYGFAFQNVSLLQAAEMAASQEKQMEVCEICGAFLIVGDAQQRIDDHLTGKQHVGFAKLRQAIKEIREVNMNVID